MHLQVNEHVPETALCFGGNAQVSDAKIHHGFEISDLLGNQEPGGSGRTLVSGAGTSMASITSLGLLLFKLLNIALCMVHVEALEPSTHVGLGIQFGQLCLCTFSVNAHDLIFFFFFYI